MKTRDLSGAETVMDVEYTSKERAQILASIDGQIEAARARRAVRLPNSAPMASRFDPRLAGFEMPFRDWVEGGESDAPLPSSEADIAFAPMADQAHWLRNRQITSRRLTGIYLGRIKAQNERLKCFAHVATELALAQADEMDALLDKGDVRGPLHGLPYGAKDLFDTMGLPTGWGAEPYEHRVPEEDATVVRLLRDAGAVLLGKTSVGALAYNDIWYGGQTKNPWNIKEGSSGSSAGSASAVAAGLCSFAIGTETLGSIVSPAERCGTVGLRPTFGRVSRAGCMALCWSLDKVGPLTRTVEDAALLLAVLNGPDAKDRGSIKAPYYFNATDDVAGLRLGHLPGAFGDGANTAHRDAFAAARSLGVEISEVKLPELPYDALVNILVAEAAAAFEDLTLSGKDDMLTWQDDEAWPNTFRKARFLSAVDHVQLDRLRYQVMQAMAAVFDQVDVLIGPIEHGPLLVATNFTGHPCVHIRAGFVETPARGLGAITPSRRVRTMPPDPKRVPHGISLWSGLFNEGPMLNLAMALEAELGVAHERPPLD